jgi:hypothetical protein
MLELFDVKITIWMRLEPLDVRTDNQIKLIVKVKKKNT